MKLVEVIPLYKGKDHDLIINYQPISLLMTISKLLEKIVYKRVYSFLELNSTLFDHQYGFRMKCSCEQAILDLTGNLLQAHNANLKSSALFLDLSKAFNTLNHEVLLSKLDKYGIRGITNKWFCSYLSQRSLVAKIPTGKGKNTYSEPFHITYGMAQGSCLGPLLFILFCNDIQFLPLFGKLILFADNTTLINHHKNKKFLDFAMVNDLEILIECFKANQLSLNLSKSVLMYFWETRDQTQLVVNNVKIPIFDSTKFLGVYIDKELRWTMHVNNLHKKLMANKFC